MRLQVKELGKEKKEMRQSYEGGSGPRERDMDKCQQMSQKILGLKHFCVKKNFGLKKLRPPKNWVKILSATAELFMIWEKVVRTNIACTNVTVTFGIC